MGILLGSIKVGMNEAFEIDGGTGCVEDMNILMKVMVTKGWLVCCCLLQFG